MEYGIKELSEIAGVSTRTLRYYDQIGLLKPSDTNDAGYRFYREEQLELLQQILFYRERGFALKEIAEILYRKDFNILSALEEHLLELEKQRKRTEQLIATLRHTIASVKGEYIMSNKEKFEAFKQKLVEENEACYGTEVREKYGDEVTDESNRKMLNMTEEQYAYLKKLGKEICQKLEEAVKAGIPTESEKARQIVKMHKEWLGMNWKEYKVDAHKGIVDMYVADERFKAYYDKEVPGCAEFLQKAVKFWAGRV